MFCLCFCMSEVIASFRSLRAGSRVFGKRLQLQCISPFGMLCLSAISMMFVNIMLAVCILVGLSQSGLCVFLELCPVSFLVVGECQSVCCLMIVRVELSMMYDCTGCPEKNYTWQRNINIIIKRAFIQQIFFFKNIVTLSSDIIQFSECSFVSPSSAHTLIHRTTHFPDKSSALSQFVVRNAPRYVLRYYECKFQLFFSYRAWLG